MIKAIYIGGPTAIIEVGGFRFITDPTLDPAGTIFFYAGGTMKLEKLQGLSSMDIGKIDFVLLSHDQHPDNLDTAGRNLLNEVTQTFTTRIGSQRLGGKSIGLDPWEKHVLPARDGSAFAFPGASIIPLHYEGWKHFTQSENDLDKTFEALGIRDRLKILKAGVVETLS